MIDFCGSINYDYDSDRDNCECDGMCRCRKIRNVQLKEVYLSGVIEKIKYEFKLKDSDSYFIDRIVRNLKMWDISKYDSYIESGWYGEELGKITFNNEDDLNHTLIQLMKLKTTDDKLRFVLKDEYSHIPPHYANLSFVERIISKDSIELGKMIKKEDSYLNYEVSYPIGVVRKVSAKGYQVMDGNHRIASAKEDKIKVFVGE